MSTINKREFKAGDSVVGIKKIHIWIPGVILQKLEHYSKPYIVKKQNG